VTVPRVVTRTAMLSDKQLGERVTQALETFSESARAPYEHRDAAAGWAAWQELQARRADRREATTPANGTAA
jgi:hypothetical protein